MSTRKIVLTVIFEIIAIFSFSYFIVMVRYAGIGTSFAFVWLGMALFLPYAVRRFLSWEKEMSVYHLP